MKRLLILVVLLGWFTSGMSQIQPPPVKERQVGFNMTTLTKKLMPFNVQSSGIQNYAMQFRKKLTDSRMYFTSAFGFNMDITENDEDRMHFDARIGLETQRPLGQKWYFGSGYNAAFYAHEIETTNFFGVNVESGFGFDKSFLLGYKINDFLSLYTETSLHFGINSSTFIKLEFLSPNAIYLNVKF